MKYLGWDETLFKNPEVFDANYLPDVLLHREMQLNQLVSNLKPAIAGFQPVNSLCLGSPATGKTSAVKLVLKQIEDFDVVTCYVNCQIVNTKHQVWTRIFESIANFQPPGGISFTKLYLACLERISKPLIVCLDDLDYLDNKMLNEMIYSVLKAYETVDVKIGLIGITTDFQILLRLDALTGSIFHANEIHFPLYSKKEIRDILKKRVDAGFYDGVLSDKAFELIVDLTYNSKDLRLGLYLLKMSGIEAERKAKRRIEVEDVERAYEGGKSLFLDKSLSALNRMERNVLKAIYVKDSITSGELYESFKNRISYRIFYEILNKLERIRLIDLKMEHSKGKTQRIFKKYDREIMLDALERISS